MNRPVILVDCDITVVRSDILWWEWLEKITGKGLKFEDVQYRYNIASYYEAECAELGVDPFAFWRKHDLYDLASPIQGSVPALKSLSQVADIVLVSVVKGNHHKSKYEFLKRHFPFMTGFVATKEKHLLKADAIVDDRHKFLNMFPDDVVKVLFETMYDQCEELEYCDLISKSWGEIGLFLEDLLVCQK